MNIFVPQSLESITECLELCLVQKQILSPKNNAPIIGIVQDSLCGATKLTLDTTQIPKHIAFDLALKINKQDQIPKNQQQISGKQIFSLCLPRDFTYESKQIKIIDGQLLSGIITKKHIGATTGGIVHSLITTFSEEHAKNFLNECQILVNAFLLHRGFTVGVSDLITEPETNAYIEKTIQECLSKCSQNALALENKTISLVPGRTAEESYEHYTMEILSKSRDLIGKHIEEKKPHETNNLSHMIFSGSKGSNVNSSQISGCVGQQSVIGKRLPLLRAGNRTFSYSLHDDKDPKARGFVKNSFMKGLRPIEFVSHAMGGREGLIDTAVKTSDSGYIQRKMIKALEDCKLEYDGTVRKYGGKIVQFTYGGDNISPEKIMRQKLILTQIKTISEFDSKFKIPEFPSINHSELEILENYRKLFLDPSYPYNTLKDDIFLAISPTIAKTTYSPIPTTSINQDLYDYHQDLQQKAISKFETCIRGNKDFLYAQFYSFFSFKKLLSVGKKAFTQELEKTVKTFIKNQASPGDMVGVLAAQSIGEPATQLTLNSFHSAGIATKAVTSGVPRLNELLNVSHNPKTPSMTIYPEDHISQSFLETKKYALSLEHKTISDITKTLYTPSHSQKLPSDPTLDYFKDLYEISNTKLSLILEIDLQKCREICQDWNPYKFVDEFIQLTNLDILPKIISFDKIIFFLKKSVTLVEEEDYLISIFKKIIKNISSEITLGGIPNIQKAHVSKNLENKTYKIETDGINIPGIFATLGHKAEILEINDPVSVHQHFGIEASRESLKKEFKNVLEYDGLYLNTRHIDILSDVMCLSGEIQPINRHGINHMDSDTLAKASFEETLGVLFSAAMVNKKEKDIGISSSIATGQYANLGTHSFEVIPISI